MLQYKKRSYDWRKCLGLGLCFIKDEVKDEKTKPDFYEYWNQIPYIPYPKCSIHFTFGYQKNNVSKFLYDPSFSLKRNPNKIYSICPPYNPKVCYGLEPFLHISTRHKIKSLIRYIPRECDRPFYHTSIPILKLDLKFALRKMSRKNKVFAEMKNFVKLKNITQVVDLIKRFDEGVVHSRLRREERSEEAKSSRKITSTYQEKDIVKKFLIMKDILVDNPKLSHRSLLKYRPWDGLHDTQFLEKLLSFHFEDIPDYFDSTYKGPFISVTVNNKYGKRRILNRIFYHELHCCDLIYKSEQSWLGTVKLPELEIAMGKAGQLSDKDSAVFYHLPEAWRTLARSFEDCFDLKRWGKSLFWLKRYTDYFRGYTLSLYQQTLLRNQDKRRKSILATIKKSYSPAETYLHLFLRSTLFDYDGPHDLDMDTRIEVLNADRETFFQYLDDRHWRLLTILKYLRKEYLPAPEVSKKSGRYDHILVRTTFNMRSKRWRSTKSYHDIMNAYMHYKKGTPINEQYEDKYFSKEAHFPVYGIYNDKHNKLALKYSSVNCFLKSFKVPRSVSRYFFKEKDPIQCWYKADTGFRKIYHRREIPCKTCFPFYFEKRATKEQKDFDVKYMTDELLGKAYNKCKCKCQPKNICRLKNPLLQDFWTVEPWDKLQRKKSCREIWRIKDDLFLRTSFGLCECRHGLTCPLYYPYIYYYYEKMMRRKRKEKDDRKICCGLVEKPYGYYLVDQNTILSLFGQELSRRNLDKFILQILNKSFVYRFRKHGWLKDKFINNEVCKIELGLRAVEKGKLIAKKRLKYVPRFVFPRYTSLLNRLRPYPPRYKRLMASQRLSKIIKGNILHYRKYQKIPWGKDSIHIHYGYCILPKSKLESNDSDPSRNYSSKSDTVEYSQFLPYKQAIPVSILYGQKLKLIRNKLVYDRFYYNEPKFPKERRSYYDDIIPYINEYGWLSAISLTSLEENFELELRSSFRTQEGLDSFVKFYLSMVKRVQMKYAMHLIVRCWQNHYNDNLKNLKYSDEHMKSLRPRPNFINIASGYEENYSDFNLFATINKFRNLSSKPFDDFLTKVYFLMLVINEFKFRTEYYFEKYEDFLQNLCYLFLKKGEERSILQTKKHRFFYYFHDKSDHKRMPEKKAKTWLRPLSNLDQRWDLHTCDTSSGKVDSTVLYTTPSSSPLTLSTIFTQISDVDDYEPADIFKCKKKSEHTRSFYIKKLESKNEQNISNWGIPGLDSEADLHLFAASKLPKSYQQRMKDYRYNYMFLSKQTGEMHIQDIMKPYTHADIYKDINIHYKSIRCKCIVALVLLNILRYQHMMCILRRFVAQQKTNEMLFRKTLKYVTNTQLLYQLEEPGLPEGWFFPETKLTGNIWEVYDDEANKKTDIYRDKYKYIYESEIRHIFNKEYIQGIHLSPMKCKTMLEHMFECFSSFSESRLRYYEKMFQIIVTRGREYSKRNNQCWSQIVDFINNKKSFYKYYLKRSMGIWAPPYPAEVKKKTTDRLSQRKIRITLLPPVDFINVNYLNELSKNSLPFYLIRESNSNFRIIKAIYDLSRYKIVGKVHKVILKQNLEETDEGTDGRLELDSIKPKQKERLSKKSKQLTKYDDNKSRAKLEKNKVKNKKVYDSSKNINSLLQETIDQNSITIHSEKVNDAKKMIKRKNIIHLLKPDSEEHIQNVESRLELDSTKPTPFFSIDLKQQELPERKISVKKNKNRERLTFILKTSMEIKRNICDYQKLIRSLQPDIIDSKVNTSHNKKRINYKQKMIRRRKKRKNLTNIRKSTLEKNDLKLKDLSSYSKTQQKYKNYSVTYKPWWMVRSRITDSIKKMKSSRFWIIEDLFQEIKEIKEDRHVVPKLVFIEPFKPILCSQNRLRPIKNKKPSLISQRNISKGKQAGDLYRLYNFIRIIRFFQNNLSYDNAVYPPLEETWTPVNYIPERNMYYKHVNCQLIQFCSNSSFLSQLFEETKTPSYQQEYCLEILNNYRLLTDIPDYLDEYIEKLMNREDLEESEESEENEMYHKKVLKESGGESEGVFDIGSEYSEGSIVHNLDSFSEISQYSMSALTSSSCTSLSSITSFMIREESELYFTDYRAYLYDQKHIDSESIICRRQRPEKEKESKESLSDISYSFSIDQLPRLSETSFNRLSLNQRLSEIELPDTYIIPIYNINDYECRPFKLWPISWYLGWIFLNINWNCRQTSLAVLSPRCSTSLPGYGLFSRTYLVTRLVVGDPRSPSFHPAFKCYGYHNPPSYDRLIALYLNQDKKDYCPVYGSIRKKRGRNRCKKRNSFSRCYFKIFKRYLGFKCHPCICVSNNFMVQPTTKGSEEEILPIISLQYCKSDGIFHKRSDLFFDFEGSDEDTSSDTNEESTDESSLSPGQSVTEDVDKKYNSDWSVKVLFKKSSEKPNQISLDVQREITRPFPDVRQYYPIEERNERFIDVADRYDKLHCISEEEIECPEFDNIKYCVSMENLLIPFLKNLAEFPHGCYEHDCFFFHDSGYNFLMLDREKVRRNEIDELIFEVPFEKVCRLKRVNETVVNIHDRIKFKNRRKKKRLPFFYFSNYNNSLNDFLTWDQYIQMILNPWKAVKLFFPSYVQPFKHSPQYIDLRKIDLVYTQIPLITMCKLYTIQETPHIYIKSGNKPAKKCRRRRLVVSYGFETPSIHELNYLAEKRSHLLSPHVRSSEKRYIQELNYLHKRLSLDVDKFKKKNLEILDGTLEDKANWKIFKDKLYKKEKESIYTLKMADPMTIDCVIEEDSEYENLKDAIKRRAIHKGDREFLFKVNEDEERLNFIQYYLSGAMYFFSYPRYYYAGFPSLDDLSLPTEKMYLYSDFKFNEKPVLQVGNNLISKEDEIIYISPEKIRILMKELYRSYSKNVIKDRIKKDRQYRNDCKIRKELEKSSTNVSIKDDSTEDEISTFRMPNEDIDFDEVDIYGREDDDLQAILRNDQNDSQDDTSSENIHHISLADHDSLIASCQFDEFSKEISPSSSTESFILRRQDREIPAKNLKPVGLVRKDEFYFIELDDLDGNEHMMSLETLIEKVRTKKFQKNDYNHFYIKGCVSFYFR